LRRYLDLMRSRSIHTWLREVPSCTRVVSGNPRQRRDSAAPGRMCQVLLQRPVQTRTLYSVHSVYPLHRSPGYARLA